MELTNVRRRPIPTSDTTSTIKSGSHSCRDCSTQAWASLSLTRSENNSWYIDLLEGWRLGITLQRTGSHLVIPRSLPPRGEVSGEVFGWEEGVFCWNTCKLCTFLLSRNSVYLNSLLFLQEPAIYDEVHGSISDLYKPLINIYHFLSYPFHPLSQIPSIVKHGISAVSYAPILFKWKAPL